MDGTGFSLFTLEQPIATPNELGEKEITWQPVQDFWGNLNVLSAREITIAKQAQLQTTHKIKCWYFEGVTSRHRITFLKADGTKRILNITGVLNPNEANLKLVIECSEKTSG